MIKAAGVLFIAPDGSSLFLKRSDQGDMAGVWCCAGGKIEDGETAEEAAIREAFEETGYKITEPMVLHTRTIQPVAAAATAPASVPVPIPGASADVGATAAPPVAPEMVDFTTFLCRVEKQFEVKLNGEHTGYAWSPITEPPQPLHPGVQTAIDRLNCDELGVARMIANGQLTSPQRYENVTLFALRITGTGTSYRKKHDEYVYRRPENYLTQDFLDRCNGLAVIMQHPKDDTLDSKEFVDRVVGMIMLPYIVSDEVWGVAKIYDDAAIKMMNERPLSTSPAVVFKSLGNTKLTLSNGSALLVEGKPILLDHLAICEHGVWDKGEGPTGVSSVEARGDSVMPDEKKSDEMPENLKKGDEQKDDKKADADEKKADADSGATLDKILTGIDSLSKRMDAYDEEDKKKKADTAKSDDADDKDEKKGDAEGDPEDVVADKKADASKRSDEPSERKEMAERIKEKEGEKKADSADTVSPAVKKMIEDVAKKLPKQISDSDFASLRTAQARADEIFQAFGGSASRPQDGEDLAGYRRRLASELKKHSASWKDVDLVTLADSAFDVAEKQVYADATHAAFHPTDLAEGTLREIRSTDVTGRISTTFAGEPRAWMSQFQPHKRRLIGIRNTSAN